MSERARLVGINHVALEVGDLDEAIQFTKDEAVLRGMELESLAKSGAALAELEQKGLGHAD